MTERELIEAKRAGYIAGARAASKTWTAQRSGQAAGEAAKLYPFPRITRPRTVAYHHVEYQVINNMLHRRHRVRRSLSFRSPSEYHVTTTWGAWHRCAGSATLFNELCNLFANPTEEVPG